MEPIGKHMKILFVFHTPQYAGYAMASLEQTFYDVGCEITKTENVHFAFSKLVTNNNSTLPSSTTKNLEIDRTSLDEKKYFDRTVSNIKEMGINIAFCFDMQPNSRLNSALRKAGVSRITSYWGSMISSLNSPLMLAIKKGTVLAQLNRPELFIFESEAMRKLATHGRGIPKSETTVIHTGVDIKKWVPYDGAKNYVREQFEIEKHKRVAIYSGHMEERKGVSVIMAAIEHLERSNGLEDWHFIICGNRPGEEVPFLNAIESKKAKSHITFAGYRNDLPLIMPGCDIGIIASTGWDSFPMSSLEMAASGLPILASNLQGTAETIEDKVTGMLFKPGDHVELAEKIMHLHNNEHVLRSFSRAARERIERKFSVTIQKKNLVMTIENLL